MCMDPDKWKRSERQNMKKKKNCVPLEEGIHTFTTTPTTINLQYILNVFNF